jgi:(S)-mandelate dehydrogenase
MPLMVSPTGLNGVFRHHADIELAEGAAAAGVPFVQSTMSNDRMEDVAKVKGLRHWWQLYVFGADEVWQEVIRRADAAGCEALVLTTNTQIFGNREWQTRTQASKTRLSIPSAVDAALHPEWFAETMITGMPSFPNVIDLVPKDHRRFFDSSSWIREHQPTSMSWDTVAAIRERWKKPFILKGLLNLEDVRRAQDSGVDGIVLGAHGGRQLDWAVSALDLLPQAREIVGDRMALYATGGLRRGTDLLKALCLGADAVMAGRAPLYGLCAGGAAGVHRALEILRRETSDAMGLLGAPSLQDLGPPFLMRAA